LASPGREESRIVGYGNIHSRVSVIAEALGMRVVYDLEDELALGIAPACCSLEELP
jgi:phosphoglycerate dehydrogenase-like enzyme